MTLYTNKGSKEIKTKDLDFINIVCDLEDKGVDIMALSDGNTEGMKMMSTVRAIFSVIVGEPNLTKAGVLLSEHLKNGGKVDEIMDAFTEAMKDAGFGNTAE